MDQLYTTSQVSNITRDRTLDPALQLYWECTNSTLPTIVLESIWTFT